MRNRLIVFTSDNGGIESLRNAYVGNVGHSPLNRETAPVVMMVRSDAVTSG